MNIKLEEYLKNVSVDDFNEDYSGFNVLNFFIDNSSYFNHVKNSPVDYFLPGLIPRCSASQ